LSTAEGNAWIVGTALELLSLPTTRLENYEEHLCGFADFKAAIEKYFAVIQNHGKGGV
jgi:hypothetical protein